MRPRNVVLALIGASLAITFACTTASTVGENPSAPKDAAPEVAPDVAMIPDAAPDTSADADAGPPDAAEAGCRDLGGSGSSGTSGGCLFGHAYDCAGTAVSITCDCPAATCRCATGGTFAHDCTNGCTPTAQERDQCGVPASTASDGGSSSGASASSGG